MGGTAVARRRGLRFKQRLRLRAVSHKGSALGTGLFLLAPALTAGAVHPLPDAAFRRRSTSPQGGGYGRACSHPRPIWPGLFKELVPSCEGAGRRSNASLM